MICAAHQVSTLAEMQGLFNGPEGLIEILHIQAEMEHIVWVGDNSNVHYTTHQLNFAPWVNAKTGNIELSWSGHHFLIEIWGGHLNQSIGKFGGSHINGGNSVAVLSMIMMWSKPHPDIEEELFCLVKAGIMWEMAEFSTIYFPDLAYHGGSQPAYKSIPMDNRLYWWLTLVGYAPDAILDGVIWTAFAVITQNGLLCIGIEMQNPGWALKL